MRVVIDTNVFVSSLVFGRKPREMVALAMLGLCDLIVSEAILKELARFLSGKFGWHREIVSLALADIRGSAEVVEPHFVVTDCADPADNRILEAAVEGRAHCIVSGDKKHLLRMKIFRGIEIITVTDCLLRLESGPSRQGS
jgi:uncharacterized protein